MSPQQPDSALKVHAQHYANGLLVSLILSFPKLAKLAQHAETIRKKCLGKE